MYDISQPASVIITLLKSYLPYLRESATESTFFTAAPAWKSSSSPFCFPVSSLFFLLSSIHLLFLFPPSPTPCSCSHQHLHVDARLRLPFLIPPSQLITLHAPRCILARAAPKSHDVGGRQKYRGIGPRRCSYLPLITCKISPPLLLTT